MKTCTILLISNITLRNYIAKKTGEFFLYGEGGGLSKYRTVIDTNSWTGGSQIIPLTEEEAKDWMEKYGDVDDYIELFGEPKE